MIQELLPHGLIDIVYAEAVLHGGSAREQHVAGTVDVDIEKRRINSTEVAARHALLDQGLHELDQWADKRIDELLCDLLRTAAQKVVKQAVQIGIAGVQA